MTITAGQDSITTGYLHRQYAESFSDIGTPRALPLARGWVIERVIPGSTLKDAMGCYPLFSCGRWTSLSEDFRALGETLVSLTVVTDPFGEFKERDLGLCFDVVRPWKSHYVVDLERFSSRNLSRRHRRNIATAQRSVRVVRCSRPVDELDEWCELYSQLVSRHGMTGLRVFSRTAFQMQWSVPGLVMFKAVADGQTVGFNTWYVQGKVAYGHLGATTNRGYELSASYALHASAIEFFSGRVRWLDLGGSAGPASGVLDGQSRFKAGWATEARTAYLCGRVFQPANYSMLSNGEATCFPAYRFAEFTEPQRVRPEL